MKALKEAWQLFLWNAGASVGDGEHGVVTFDPGRHADFAPDFVVVDGVGQEVRDDLLDAVGVAARRRGAEFTVQLNVASGGERGAEFVRGVGGELLLLGKGGFEPREGGVEHAGEAAEFVVGIGAVDALGQIPPRRCGWPRR